MTFVKAIELHLTVYTPSTSWLLHFKSTVVDEAKLQKLSLSEYLYYMCVVKKKSSRLVLCVLQECLPADIQVQFSASRELIRNIHNSFQRLRDRAEKMAERSKENATDLLMFGRELRYFILVATQSFCSIQRFWAPHPQCCYDSSWLLVWNEFGS